MTDRKSKKRKRDSGSTSPSNEEKSTAETARKNSSKHEIGKEEEATKHEYNKGIRRSSLSSGVTDCPDINNSNLGTYTKKTKKRRKDKNDKEKPKKRKKEKKKKGHEKKKHKNKKEEKLTKKEILVKDSVSERVSASSQIQAFDAQKSVLTESVSKLLPKRKAMVPMTKEEYEKEQAQIRRVYDPETGRNRLMKGTGEILEEIVSKERHRAINKAATLGDGAFFQSNLGLKDR